MKILSSTFFILLVFSLHGQEMGNVKDRIVGIRYQNNLHLNTNAMEIIVELVEKEFELNNIIQNQTKAVVKKKELVTLDSAFDFDCYLVQKDNKKTATYDVFYYAKSLKGEILYITIISMFPHDKELNNEIVKAIRNEEIPSTSIFSINNPTICIAGRNITVNNTCAWMAVASIQCPYDAQIDWSMFDTKENAEKHLNYRLTKIKEQNFGRVVSDTILDVIFLDHQTKARKVIYDFKGVSSALLKLSGTDRIVIYYLASEIENYSVSCVMSFWEHKSAHPFALPPMLEKILVIK